VHWPVSWLSGGDAVRPTRFATITKRFATDSGRIAGRVERVASVSPPARTAGYVARTAWGVEKPFWAVTRRFRDDVGLDRDRSGPYRGVIATRWRRTRKIAAVAGTDRE